MNISGKTKLLCVIGDPIEHTMSPKMHNTAIEELGLDYAYVAFHVTPDKLDKAVEGFRSLQIAGINVTIPHKIEIMRYLDEIDPVARGIGAINTIKNDNGKLIAKNTDAEGAMKAIQEAGIDASGARVSMLGCGGAARAIIFSLAKEKAKVDLLVRKADLDDAESLVNDVKGTFPSVDFPILEMTDEALKESLASSSLLVNATPVGMYPNSDVSLIKEEMLHESLSVFDVVYNPLETKLLKQAMKVGSKVVHGIDMLVYQGALAFEWWTGHEPPVASMKKAAVEALGLK